MGDAVSAKQAAIDADQPGGLRWIVPGQIEECDREDAANRARGRAAD
jgi:hypothetical protein